jgi:hypothetical protein
VPEEVIAWVVRSIGTRDLWDWLGEESRLGLRFTLLSGFRAVPANLKQPAVSKRLITHCATHRDVLRELIELWRGNHKPLFEAVEEREDDSLIPALPILLHAHGAQALGLALVVLGRAQALEALEDLQEPHAEADASTPESTPQSAPGTSTVASSTSEASEPLRAALSEAREREQKLSAGLNAALARAEKERDKMLLKGRESDRAFKALENRASTLEAEKSEAKKLLDRTERRLRHVEREKEELEVDNKRLRRQMRRQQEISEEVRKQLARANSELESLRPAPPSTSPAALPSTSKASASPSPGTKTTGAPAKPLSLLDREFVLSADGRTMRVTPREVARRVDANDEEWVFRLIQSLDAIAHVDAGGHKTFLDALKPLGFYYSRVLLTNTLRVLVDASNVARFEKDEAGRGRLKYLLAMREELRRRDCFPIKLIADASLPYNVDDPETLLAMARRGEIEMSSPGQEADEILAREARRTGAYVVTNDRGFFHKATPDFEPPRITFRIVAGHLIVDEF